MTLMPVSLDLGPSTNAVVPGRNDDGMAVASLQLRAEIQPRIEFRRLAAGRFGRGSRGAGQKASAARIRIELAVIDDHRAAADDHDRPAFHGAARVRRIARAVYDHRVAARHRLIGIPDRYV